jgi:hypothetical protein
MKSSKERVRQDSCLHESIAYCSGELINAMTGELVRRVNGKLCVDCGKEIERITWDNIAGVFVKVDYLKG